MIQQCGTIVTHSCFIYISLYIQRRNVSRTRWNYARFVDYARLFALWKSSNSRVSHCRLRWQFSLDIRLFTLTRGSKFNCFSPGCVAFESSREFLKPSQWLPTKRTMLFPASYVDPSMFNLKRNSFAYFSSLSSPSWDFSRPLFLFYRIERFFERVNYAKKKVRLGLKFFIEMYFYTIVVFVIVKKYLISLLFPFCCVQNYWSQSLQIRLGWNFTSNRNSIYMFLIRTKRIQDLLKFFFKLVSRNTSVKIYGWIYRSTFLLNETFACLSFVSKVSPRDNGFS